MDVTHVTRDVLFVIYEHWSDPTILRSKIFNVKNDSITTVIQSHSSFLLVSEFVSFINIHRLFVLFLEVKVKRTRFNPKSKIRLNRKSKVSLKVLL